MLKTSHHSGVEGYVIKNIKNQIDFGLKVPQSHAALNALSGSCCLYIQVTPLARI